VRIGLVPCQAYDPSRKLILINSLLSVHICLVEGQSASMTRVCAVPPDTVPHLTVEELLSAQCHLDMLSAFPPSWVLVCTADFVAHPQLVSMHSIGFWLEKLILCSEGEAGFEMDCMVGYCGFLGPRLRIPNFCRMRRGSPPQQNLLANGSSSTSCSLPCRHDIAIAPYRVGPRRRCCCRRCGIM
jgi:hypothetical protein